MMEYIQCPNCKSAFELHLSHLPPPKFNNMHSGFGWKFECAHCDSQWWVALKCETLHTPSSQKLRPMREFKGVSDPLFDITHPYTQSQKYTQLPTYSPFKSYTQVKVQASFPSPWSPISKEDEGFNSSTSATIKEHNSPSLKLVPIIANKKKKRSKKPWLLFVIIFLISIGFMMFEHYYPKKINSFLREQYIYFMYSDHFKEIRNFFNINSL